MRYYSFKVLKRAAIKANIDLPADLQVYNKLKFSSCATAHIEQTAELKRWAMHVNKVIKQNCIKQKAKILAYKNIEQIKKQLDSLYFSPVRARTLHW